MTVVKSLPDVVRLICRDVDGIKVIGVTGRNGAGKTSKVSPAIQKSAEEYGVSATILPFDAFLIKSSEDRAAWIAEGDRLGHQESAHRRNELNWWDFGKLASAVEEMKRGNAVHLQNIRNPADGGRLTGELYVPAPRKPGFLVVEGKGIAHLDCHDVLFFVHAPSDIRLARLCRRDTYRTPEQSRARFELTEHFENWYFPQHKEKIHYWVDNSSQEKDLLVSTNLEEIL